MKEVFALAWLQANGDERRVCPDLSRSNLPLLKMLDVRSDACCGIRLLEPVSFFRQGTGTPDSGSRQPQARGALKGNRSQAGQA